MRFRASIWTLSAIPLALSLATPFQVTADGQQQPLGLGRETPADSLTCHLPPEQDPSQDGLPSANAIFSGQDALEAHVKRHQAVVRVPTVCYDDLGDFDTDPRWGPFYTLHQVLEKTYPAVHRRARVEKINTFGLVFTLEGTNPSLKPALFAAHQDVVPPGGSLAWKYPPFEAHFDGEWLWGRGAVDDKASLTAVLSAVEALASNSSWTPARTIVLAFGFDEECSGYRGAGTIGEHLLQRYGKDGFELILDEGSTGIQVIDDTKYAVVGVLEKGHVDITFALSVRGGHSSTPTPHTGIGIAADIVAALEARRHEPELSVNSPVYRHLACQAEFSPDSEPEIFEYLKTGDLGKIASELARRSAASRYALSSSVAVTTIKGGEKINALPETVTIGVNFRVAPQDSVVKIQHDIVSDIADIVEKFGIKVVAYEGDDEYEAYAALVARSSPQPVTPKYEVYYNATLTLTASEKFPVTPLTPTQGPVWDLFAGSIRHSLKSKNDLVVPVGEIMMGNTDTRHYLELSRNIYRWLPFLPDDIRDYHAVDEGIRVEAILKMAGFYYDLIRNVGLSS